MSQDRAEMASSLEPDDSDRLLLERARFQTNVFNTGTVVVGHGRVNVGRVPADKDDLSVGRQSFLFDFYKQALKQADTTFRMSLIFMSLGAIIVLTGGVLALAPSNTAGPDSISLVTALSGALIGSCGGAFAIHANRARRHLTAQAEKMEKDLQADRKLEQTLRLIDEVENTQLRDRLKSVTAMRVLDLGPDPETVADHLLAHVPKPSGKELPAVTEEK